MQGYLIVLTFLFRSVQKATAPLMYLAYGQATHFHLYTGGPRRPRVYQCYLWIKSGRTLAYAPESFIHNILYLLDDRPGEARGRHPDNRGPELPGEALEPAARLGEGLPVGAH